MRNTPPKYLFDSSSVSSNPLKINSHVHYSLAISYFVNHWIALSSRTGFYLIRGWIGITYDFDALLSKNNYKNCEYLFTSSYSYSSSDNEFQSDQSWQTDSGDERGCGRHHGPEFFDSGHERTLLAHPDNCKWVFGTALRRFGLELDVAFVRPLTSGTPSGCWG